MDTEGHTRQVCDTCHCCKRRWLPRCRRLAASCCRRAHATRRASSRRSPQRSRTSWAPHYWWARPIETIQNLPTFQRLAARVSRSASPSSSGEHTLNARRIPSIAHLLVLMQVVNDALLKGVSKSSLGGEALDASEGGGGGGLLTLLLSLFLSGGKMALVWDVVAQVVSSIDGPLVRTA